MPLPVIVPPVRPLPAVMLVTVPPALLSMSFAHVHALPFHFSSCPDVQPLPASIAAVMPALATLTVPLPVIGPPVSPAPVATLVTVPVPPAAAHTHPPPFHCGTWFAAHAVVGKSCVAARPVPRCRSPGPVATLVTVPSSVSHDRAVGVDGPDARARCTRRAHPPLQVRRVRRDRPVVVIGPPVNPAPVATLVTVPVPAASVPHAQPPAPLLFGTWPLLHACGN